MGEEKRNLRDHARVDDGLKAAFGEPGGGALEAIERLSGTWARVLLRDAPEDASPVLRLARPVEEGAFADDSRYQVLGEIGRGGMGTVYKGRDKDLGRDVALKVLRADLAEEASVVQRFVEEAQVGGQLQHPGIVPIYGLGLQKGGRPYFAMKLVKGETLTSLLEGGGKGSELIRVFERVAQTVAYAHSRGVIHRDLKPSNVMVGAFGEVHVVDWGFAKVLGRKETHPRPGATVVATVRTGAEGSQSVAGSVMGTPAYMPPEQAMGQVEELTERSDVFALGAILCEILTRQPPYTGTMQDQLIAAAQARLKDAYGRLESCSAPDALKQLARDCLQPLPRDRPKDAGQVAQRVAEHLASVEERARQAEVDAVHAASEARRVQRARRTMVVLAGVVLVAIVGGSGGLIAWKSADRAQAMAAAERVAPLLREATRLEGENAWPRAKAAAATALELARTEGADEETLAAARTVHARIGAEAEAEKAREEKIARETRLLDDLDELRMQSKDIRRQQRESRYREVFAAFGVDPDAEDAAAALADFCRPVELAIHLDWWAMQRRSWEDDRWRALDRLARVLDDDSWRTRVRDTVEAGDAAALRALADEADSAAQSAATIVLLANYLQKAGDAEAAAALLRRGVVRYPADLWIHDALAGVLWWDLRRAPEAMSHAQAAVALRPQSGGAWSNLGAIRNDGFKDHDGAIRAFRRALELSPDSAVARHNLGEALQGKGDHDGALAAFREAIRLDPNDASSLASVGTILGLKGDLDGALAALREAVRLDPKCAMAHWNLGTALALKGDLDGALASTREAIRLDPGAAEAHRSLGGMLQGKGDLDGALASYREALRLDPNNYAAYINMGGLLCDLLGRYDEAIAAFREAVRLNPDDPQGYANLGIALGKKGDADAAIAAFRECLRLAPDANVHYSLGNALSQKGDRAGAIASYREAIRLDPNLAKAHTNLGIELNAQGDIDGAIACYREAIRLDPSLPEAHANLGAALAQKGDADGAIVALRESLRLAPDANVHCNLGNALSAKGDLDGAIACYREAVRLDPKQYEAWNCMGAVLSDKLMRYDEAIAAFREAIRIDPNLAAAHNNLGIALRLKGDRDGALTALREAVRLDPRWATAHANLGLAFLEAGDFEDAVAAYREALRLDPSDFGWHNNLAYTLVATGDFEGAVAAYREVLRLDPKNYRAWIDLGVTLCDRLSRYDEAIAAFRDAIRIDANQWQGHTYLGVALLNKGEFGDSVKALRKAVTLENPVSGWLESLLRRVEGLAAAEARLPAVLKGEDRPASADEWAAFAEVLHSRKDYVSAVRFWAKCFEADGRVAKAPDAQRGFTAACSAALAGRDWHGQALAWLRAELDANVAALGSDAPAVAGRMRQWKSDRDLAGVRDVDGLSEEWRVFWAEVDALLRRAEEASK